MPKRHLPVLQQRQGKTVQRNIKKTDDAWCNMCLFLEMMAIPRIHACLYNRCANFNISLKGEYIVTESPTLLFVTDQSLKLELDIMLGNDTTFITMLLIIFEQCIQ